MLVFGLSYTVFEIVSKKTQKRRGAEAQRRSMALDADLPLFNRGEWFDKHQDLEE